MQKIENIQIHYGQEPTWPTGLKNAKDISEALGIPENRIIELANAHIMPHRRIDGGEPLFQVSEIKKWAAKNLIQRFDGQEIPFELKITIEPEPAETALPELMEMKNLKQISLHNCVPGIYFLVENNKIVYIGQSVNPIVRVNSHKDKLFTHAYMIPVPTSSLDGVEGALIRKINPKLNSGEKEIAVGPGNRNEDIMFLEKYVNNPDALNGEI